MSGWATTEIGGPPVSAWEYRSRFLSDGEVNTVFYCPFCDVRLVGCLIHKEGELSKSPHFSARWEDHRFGCNGDPVEVDDPERKPPKAHYTPRLMHFPEELTSRPPARVVHPKGTPTTVVMPTSIEDISTRRRAAGLLGKPIPRTYLLQPIVEAFNITVKEIFDAEKEKGWDVAKRKSEIKKALSALPLNLEDKTDYDDAFRFPSFVKYNFPRIYHGIGIISYSGSDIIVISSKNNGKIKGGPVPFEITIESTGVSSALPRSHSAILQQLRTFSEEKKEFRWYAYGKPVQTNDKIVLPIRNLDHLYLKHAFNKL